MNSVMRIRNLFVWFRDIEILKSVSLDIGEGEIACITGSTGSGKTTLLKVVTGVIPELYSGFRVEGDISIYGMDPVKALHKGIVTYVPQDVYSFFIAFTPREELAVLGIKECRCDIDLDIDVDRLSDGQLYRFLLHSALLSGAKLIAIDEPSSHIDWWSIEDVFEYLKKFVWENRLVVMVAEHRIDLVKKFCNRVIELSKASENCSDLPKLRKNTISDAVVRAENVHVIYNGRHILRGINLSIGFGEAVAIVGKNGSGKTTLLSVLAGILKPSRGRIFIDKGKKIFVVPQNPVYWFPNGNVKNIVRLFVERCSFGEKIESVLEMFELVEEADKDVYSLSIGKARLLSIALAYVSKADVIMVDEPTLGLDCRSRSAILNAFDKLLERGKSIVIATHDFTFTKSFNTMYVLDNGIAKALSGGDR